jgi:hypothetical protein
MNSRKRGLKWLGLALVLYIGSKVLEGVIGDVLLAATPIIAILGVVNLLTPSRKSSHE